MPTCYDYCVCNINILIWRPLNIKVACVTGRTNFPCASHFRVCQQACGKRINEQGNWRTTMKPPSCQLCQAHLLLHMPAAATCNGNQSRAHTYQFSISTERHQPKQNPAKQQAQLRDGLSTKNMESDTNQSEHQRLRAFDTYQDQMMAIIIILNLPTSPKHLA